jgi:hypothetical protein
MRRAYPLALEWVTDAMRATLMGPQRGARVEQAIAAVAEIAWSQPGVAAPREMLYLPMRLQLLGRGERLATAVARMLRDEPVGCLNRVPNHMAFPSTHAEHPDRPVCVPRATGDLPGLPLPPAHASAPRQPVPGLAIGRHQGYAASASTGARGRAGTGGSASPGRQSRKRMTVRS